MTFMNRLGRFARSSEGKKLIKQTQDLANDPDTKRRIGDVRDRLIRREKPKAKAP